MYNRKISFISVFRSYLYKVKLFPLGSLKLKPSSPSLEELPPPLVTSLPSYMMWCEQRLRLSSMRALENLVNIDQFAKLLLPTTPTSEEDSKSIELRDTFVDILR